MDLEEPTLSDGQADEGIPMDYQFSYLSTDHPDFHNTTLEMLEIKLAKNNHDRFIDISYCT